jgi:DNA modification methylase
MSWSILEGDCIDVMRTLPAQSVDAVITSPPYAMQRKATYGGVPEAEYPAWTVAWMAEARRLLKPNGSVVVNISPFKAGGQLSDYVLRTRLALRDVGWSEIDELIWHKPNAMPGGKPDRPRRVWESLLWYGMHGNVWADPLANGTPHKEPARGARAFQTASPAKRQGWDHKGGSNGVTPLRDVARATNMVTLAKSRSTGVDHPAPYPPALAEWVGKLVCPQGGTILDPYSGSASTGVACIRNGWDYIGIEAMSEYVEMSRKRLAHTEAERAA